MNLLENVLTNIHFTKYHNNYVKSFVQSNMNSCLGILEQSGDLEIPNYLSELKA